MINETFYSKRLKCMIRQISKQAARKLWDEGKEIFFLPSYIKFDNTWMRPMEAEKNGFSFQGYTFDRVCDDYKRSAYFILIRFDTLRNSPNSINVKT